MTILDTDMTVLQGRAMEAHLAHNQDVAGSSPVPAIALTKGERFPGLVMSADYQPGYEWYAVMPKPQLSVAVR